MKPFEDKLKNLSSTAIPKYGPWAFLQGWKSPINEGNLEDLSERGEHDAKVRLPPTLFRRRGEDAAAWNFGDSMLTLILDLS